MGLGTLFPLTDEETETQGHPEQAHSHQLGGTSLGPGDGSKVHQATPRPEGWRNGWHGHAEQGSSLVLGRGGPMKDD